MKNKKNKKGQQAQETAQATKNAQQSTVNASKEVNVNNATEANDEQKLMKKAYELAPEWKISVIAKRRFMNLPSILQNGAGKEACVKDALAGHKELIPDPTRYWIWLVDETRKLTLHIRRRRWLDEEGKNVILDVYSLANNGTKFSDEFAEFLKKKLGPDPRYRKIVGALLYD